MNACWTGWSRPSSPGNPSRVVTGPATADTGRSQDERARPPMRTEHAPHSPTPQPNFGPARPRSWRSTSSNGVSGSQVTLRSVPFTVSRNSVSVRVSPAALRASVMLVRVSHEVLVPAALRRAQMLGQPGSGHAARVTRDVFRRTRRHDVPAARAAFRPHVDEVVRGGEQVQVVV